MIFRHDVVHSIWFMMPSPYAQCQADVKEWR